MTYNMYVLVHTSILFVLCSSLLSIFSLRVLSTGSIAPAVLNTILLTVSSGTWKSSLENTFLFMQKNICF